MPVTEAMTRFVTDLVKATAELVEVANVFAIAF
jgi:hypothetical protein